MRGSLHLSDNSGAASASSKHPGFFQIALAQTQRMPGPLSRHLWLNDRTSFQLTWVINGPFRAPPRTPEGATVRSIIAKTAETRWTHVRTGLANNEEKKQGSFTSLY